jgi:hypothetical protein
MKLLSVNVGLPRDVPWHGRHARTAIFKSPVVGRSRVERLNVDGDGQADLVAHGGKHRAVCSSMTGPRSSRPAPATPAASIPAQTKRRGPEQLGKPLGVP